MSFIHASPTSLNKPMKKWGKIKMGKIINKRDRAFHFRFNSLYEAYSFLSDLFYDDACSEDNVCIRRKLAIL